MKKLIPILLLISICCLIAPILTMSCAPLQPGADPFVVSIERTETSATATFQAILKVDHIDRAFWSQELPAFHGFCEWLREPQAYQVTNTVPRWAGMMLTLNDAKHAYLAAKSAASSNVVWSVLQGVESAANQAIAWQQLTSSRNTQ